MTSPNLLIPLATSELQTCIPNLMPFHINYSGPAQVSAFMRVEKYKREDINVNRPTKELVDNVDKQEEDVEMKDQDPGSETPTPTPNTGPGPVPLLSGASSTDSVMSAATVVAESQDTIVATADDAEGVKHPSLSAPPLEDEERRYTSAFRGRSIHGLTVDLPAGYSGLVLRAEANPNVHGGAEVRSKEDEAKGSKANAKAKGKGKAAAGTKAKAGTVTTKDEPEAKPRGRLTRSAAPKHVEEPIVVQDDEQEKIKEEENTVPEPDINNDNTPMDPFHDSKPIRHLVPTAQFSSFTLWHADRPVDKGNDEYARTLKEWLALAHEINRTDLGA